MTYEECLRYIENVQKFGSKLGLTNITVLLDKLGNPQKDLKIIHVAGTNGKGSVCAMISSVLRQAGYQVGLYTSPHLIDYNERIQINGAYISNEDFTALINEMKKRCTEMVEEGRNHPTFFEILTAMALWYFTKKKTDYVVLEVGLGGRYDATNVINNPLVSVITSISLDHTDVLGDTIEKIAWEKGGIIKENHPVVLYSEDKQVYNVINDISRKRNSPLYYNNEIIINHVKHQIEGQSFSIKTSYYQYDDLYLNLIGEHQLYNAAIALLAIYVLQKNGINIVRQHIIDGFQKVQWPGRMEVFSGSPLILLDGAHNPAGVNALKDILSSRYKNWDITLLFGVLEDKSYDEMINTLTPCVNRIILTEPNSKRALSVTKLKEVIRDRNIPIYEASDIEKAVCLGKQLTEGNSLLCCAGSLYLIGDVRKLLIKGGRVND